MENSGFGDIHARRFAQAQPPESLKMSREIFYNILRERHVAEQQLKLEP